MIRLLVASLLVSDAFAFELSKTSTGAELHWDPPSFAYGAQLTIGDPAGEAFAAAVRGAADTWVNGSKLGVQMTWAGPDHTNLIQIAATWNEDFGEVARTVAHTEVVYDVDTGRISEGDIFLNGETFTFAGGDGFEPWSVVLHEMGHLIGIAHSCGDPGTTYPSCFSLPEEVRTRVLDAVMAPTLAPGVVRAELAPDDLEALAVHYPGTAEGARPTPIGVLTLCETGMPYVSDIHLSSLRLTTGEVRPLERWEGTADVVVTDPESGLYTVYYSLEAPPPCMPQEEGCSCSTHRQGAGNGAMLWLVLAMVALRRRAVVPILVLLGVLSSGEALAFKCSRVGTGFGPSLIWSSRVIPWYADAELFGVYGDAVMGEEDVLASFKEWEDVGCSDVSFPLAAIVPNLRAEYLETDDNRNAVVALDSAWLYDRGALAVTTSAYDVRTGVVVDADIEINAEHFTFARVDDSCVPNDGTMDLRNTITHEVGHIIGLDHPPNTPSYEDVTMFASAPPCEDKKRSLEPDDIDGLCSIYPAGNPNRQCYPPDGPSFMQTDSDDGFGCSTTNGGAQPWVLILLIVWWRRGRSAAPR